MRTRILLFTCNFSIAVIVGLVYLSPQALAQTEQEKRLEDMGFISISDESVEMPVEVHVPTPKVINISNKDSDQSEDDEMSASFEEFEQILDSEEESAESRSVQASFEIEPILVTTDGATIADEEMMPSASDEEIRKVATTVLPDEQEADDLDLSIYVHEREAHNFYNYKQRDRKFLGIGLGKTWNERVEGFEDDYTGEKSLFAEDLRELGSGTDEEREPMPPLKYSIRSERQYEGLPLIDGYIQVTGGYRVDELDFNIASDITGSLEPNIISELTWDHIQIKEIRARSQFVFAKHFVADAKAGYGYIVSGDNQDSDYLGNNRTNEFSRSNNNTNDGDVLDYSIAGGLHFEIRNPPDPFLVDYLSMNLLVGYSYHEQNFEITDLNQTIPELGEIPGLDSRYETEWDGPWAGIELMGTNKRRNLTGFGRFEYHLPEFEAEAQWNLRDDFQQPKSFEHVSDDGYGFVFEGGGFYQISDVWRLNLNYNFTYFHMDDGIIRFFLANGQQPIQRLNEVNWTSWSITGGISAVF